MNSRQYEKMMKEALAETLAEMFAGFDKLEEELKFILYMIYILVI
jgi:hypothetical protein